MYAANKPYPNINVKRRNTDYAKLLLHDYAGINGEDTAIHQYFYQSLIVPNKNLSEDLKHISEVEMKHLDILGRLIELLGIKPIFGVLGDNSLTPWTAKYIDYSVKVKDILIQNIKHERLAIETYLKHIEVIDDEDIKAILERIIEDEIVHIKIFYSYLKKEK